MATKVRVMHYLNQFFAGVGGEDKADAPPGSLEGAVGPGKRLQNLLGDAAEIVVSAYCGDNYFSEHHDKTVKKILEIAKAHDIKIVVAGPAFASGRYGLSCIEACQSVSTSLGLDCVTAMHPENPGIEIYKQYKDRKVFAFPTTEVVSGMEDALAKMAGFISKLVAESGIGSASKEGYIPRGFRIIEFGDKSGAKRAVDMLLNKIAGRPFVTEIPIASFEPVPVPPRIENLKKVHLALVCTGGIIRPGNPDGFKAIKNTKWVKYPIDELDSMTDTKWEVMHGGYNNEFMQKNPNYGVPLDVCKKMEREGIFGKLYSYFYGTTGVLGTVSAMQTIGRGIALDMKKDGVNAVLLVST